MSRNRGSRRTTRASAPTRPKSKSQKLSSKLQAELTLPESSAALALVPAALALLTSAPSLCNKWAADDIEQVLKNSMIKNIANIPLAFTTSVWQFGNADIVLAVDAYFRPLFSILFILNYKIFGTASWGWHMVSVLIHSGVAYLAYLVLKEVTRSGINALVAGVLFAVHPAHAESVAWVSGVTDPLMALFLLPAFLFYLRFKASGRKKLFGLTLGLYFFGLLSKETALAMPLVIAYCEIIHFKEAAPLPRRALRTITLVSLFVFPTAAYFLLRYAALGSVLFGSPRYPIGMALATAPLALVKYISLMLVPWGYSYQHYTNFVGSLASRAFLGPVALILTLAAFILWTKSRMLWFATAWFAIWLAAPLAAMRQFDPEYLVQERYVYLPSIGVCLAAALGLEWITKNRLARPGISSRVQFAAMAVVVVGLSAVYIRQTWVWRDTVSVYENCVAVEPASVIARVDLAQSYFSVGRKKEAEDQARQALEAGPGDPAPYLMLSYFADSSGRIDAAINYLEQGADHAALTPITKYNLATLYLNLGFLYERRKNFDRADRAFNRSLEIWPRVVGWYSLGEFYQNQSRYEEARLLFEKAASQVSRRYAPIHLKLGQVYDQLGEFARARSEYERYVELAPNARDRGIVMKRIAELQ